MDPRPAEHRPRRLDGLDSIGTELWLDDLDKLESVDGLGGLRMVGSLSITDNASLRSRAGLAQLQRVDDRVQIKRNAMLPRSEIDALLSRIEVGGEVDVD